MSDESAKLTIDEAIQLAEEELAEAVHLKDDALTLERAKTFIELKGLQKLMAARLLDRYTR